MSHRTHEHLQPHIKVVEIKGGGGRPPSQARKANAEGTGTTVVQKHDAIKKHLGQTLKSRLSESFFM
jgi:hypothetical protein